LREHIRATGAQRAAAKEGLAIAKAKLHELRVSVDVVGADVYVDGESVGASPLPDPLYLDPGEHTIGARMGEKRSAVTVVSRAGKSTKATLQLSAEAAAARGAAAAARGEEADEDDEEDEEEPEEDAVADTGTGRGLFGWFISRPLAWVGVAVTVLGVAGGVYYSTQSRDAYDDADRVTDQIIAAAAIDPEADAKGLCANLPEDSEWHEEYEAACDALHEDWDRGDKAKRLSTISFVVGGAAAAGTIVYYFLDKDSGAPPAAARKSPSDRARATVSPVFARGFAGLSIAGRF
jgi:ribosomal protein L12E/L44/L45/RPP1/RPP2